MEVELSPKCWNRMAERKQGNSRGRKQKQAPWTDGGDMTPTGLHAGRNRSETVCATAGFLLLFPANFGVEGPGRRLL